jgi:hypothetical protein
VPSWLRASSTEKPRRSPSRKNPFAQGAVGGRGERLDDRADQRRVLGDLPGEQLLAGEDVGGDELLAHRGELDVRSVDGGQVEQHRGVGQRQQVVDLKGDVVRDLGEAVPSAAGGEDLQQPRRDRRG